MSFDDNRERFRGGLTLDYVLGRDGALDRFVDRTYGVGFELPLTLAERAFGLEDSRHAYLTRHLLTRLFYLAGGLFAYLLARRLFGSGALALAVLLLFLIHPRIYGHSFFNSKDVSFLSMFMIALFLTHRAFRRDTIWAFALLGAGAGVLMNIRLAGALLVPAVLAMRGCDFFFAASGEGRRRVLTGAFAFATAAPLALYAAWPYLWSDPIGRFAESFASMARFHYDPVRLFRGAAFTSETLPADYILTWFAITTPPFALLLGGVGAGALLRRGFARPMRIVRNTRLRFAFLLVGCFALPVAMVVLLDSAVYGLRHMFFLYAPFSLLAGFGLQWLLSNFGRRRLRAAVYAAAGAGGAAALVAMALIHPFQYASFNFLVDRTTPERLKTQYSLHLTGVWGKLGMERALALQPSGPLTLEHNLNVVKSRAGFPQADRDRMRIVNEDLARFSLTRERPDPGGKTLGTWSIYNNVLAFLSEKEPGDNPYPAAYESVRASEPVARSEYDLYLNRGERSLTYARDACVLPEPEGLFYLLVYPERTSDLPEAERGLGRANISFHFQEHGAEFDGKCAAVVPLPDYPIAAIRTGQTRSFDRAPSWEEAFPFADPGVYRSAYERAASREPDVRAAFDLHLGEEGRTLIYAREPCAPSDIALPFFLHVRPKSLSDLPEERLGLGFEARDFDFRLRGFVFDGKCAAVVPLPDYAVASVRSGQWVRGEGEVWEATLLLGE